MDIVDEKHSLQVPGAVEQLSIGSSVAAYQACTGLANSLLSSRTPQGSLERVTGSDIVLFLRDRSEGPQGTCLIHVQCVYVLSEIQMGSLLTAVSARLPGERLESWLFSEPATAFSWGRLSLSRSGF